MAVETVPAGAVAPCALSKVMTTLLDDVGNMLQQMAPASSSSQVPVGLQGGRMTTAKTAGTEQAPAAAVVRLPTAAAVAPIQPKRCGRYPRGVVSINCRPKAAPMPPPRPRLAAGDFAEIVGMSENDGKVVFIESNAPTPNGAGDGEYFRVESVSGPLACWYFSTGLRGPDRATAIFAASLLQRVIPVWRPAP